MKPPPLETKEQRLAFVLHHCGNWEHLWRDSRAAGIPDEEIREGVRLALYEEELRQLGTRIYGQPEYGSWPTGALNELRRRFPMEGGRR